MILQYPMYWYSFPS
ncbi:NAD(P)H-dependent oxidoreductase [Helicobacter suis]